jgi:hypothetical protein
MPLGPAKILPGVVASFAVAGVFWHLTRNVKIFGGKYPRSVCMINGANRSRVFVIIFKERQLVPKSIRNSGVDYILVVAFSRAAKLHLMQL